MALEEIAIQSSLWMVISCLCLQSYAFCILFILYLPACIDPDPQHCLQYSTVRLSIYIIYKYWICINYSVFLCSVAEPASALWLLYRYSWSSKIFLNLKNGSSLSDPEPVLTSLKVGRLANSDTMCTVFNCTGIIVHPPVFIVLVFVFLGQVYTRSVAEPILFCPAPGLLKFHWLRLSGAHIFLSQNSF